MQYRDKTQYSYHLQVMDAFLEFVHGIAHHREDFLCLRFLVYSSVPLLHLQCCCKEILSKKETLGFDKTFGLHQQKAI